MLPPVKQIRHVRTRRRTRGRGDRLTRRRRRRRRKRRKKQHIEAAVVSAIHVPFGWIVDDDMGTDEEQLPLKVELGYCLLRARPPWLLIYL